MNGKPPVHPELLDWLACELMDNGWKMKPLHRLMVTSNAYRRASAPSAEDRMVASGNAAVDPENRQLWRQNSYRMEAEVVRDATLHVAGQLDKSMSGPDLDPGTGLTVGRRSIYFRTSKEKTMTFLSTFDSPNPVECYQRAESISPQQSLAMSNSPLTLGQSRNVAAKLSPNDFGAGGKQGHRICNTRFSPGTLSRTECSGADRVHRVPAPAVCSIFCHRIPDHICRGNRKSSQAFCRCCSAGS